MSWQEFIKQESEKDYFRRIEASVKRDSHNGEIFPKHKDLFSAYRLCPIDKLKVVILGQDPYHSPGQAHGLAFSVPKGIPAPPSLQNIYKEIRADLRLDTFEHGCLTSWAEQGVFLLNSVLTVRSGLPGSHRDFGWQRFTDETINVINRIDKPIVFMLWGNYAKAKRGLLTNKYHHILEAPHPSPLSAHNGFFGCKHFSKANDFLYGNEEDPIDWSVR